jgi:phosphatidylinositol glycan class B
MPLSQCNFTFLFCAPNTILILHLYFSVLTASSIFLIDSWYYQKPTFTPLNFLLTNLSSVSQFYGKSPWHYHLVQSLPILCTTTLPFVLHGTWIALSFGSYGLKTMLACVVWTVGVYSSAGHKEWRFIHPLLPLLHIFAAKSLVDLHGHAKQTSSTKKKTRTPTRLQNLRRFLPPIRIAHLFFILLSVPASVYVVLEYCSEPISVVHYFRHLPAHELHGSVGFLMPCHSTPGHAYLHRKELATDNRMWALGCEPPLG